MSDDDLGLLLKRIQRLEDILAIKVLKCKYARACDDGFYPDTMSKIIIENAIDDGGCE